MKQARNIFLMGYMGCGKSTVGSELALELKRRFVDLDAVIEERAGKSVNEIFKEEGEDVFRWLEKERLAEIASAEGQIIAVGGGTPMKPENFGMMKSSGITVYLELPVADLIKRLRSDRENRPLLADMDNDQLEAFVTAHFQKREPVYQRADICVPATIAVKDLIETLNSYSR